MNELQIAQRFSRQLERVLAGDSPGNSNPLLTLAEEANLATNSPPRAIFAQELRDRLERKLKQQSRQAPPRNWVRGVITTALLLVILSGLLLTQKSLSVQEVLAKAIDSLIVQPGQIIHTLSRIEIQNPSSNQEPRSSMTEYWARTEVGPRGEITVTEVAGNIHPVDDLQLSAAIMHHYATQEQICAWEPVSKTESCAPLSPQGTTHPPDPLAVYAGESLQKWLARLQKNTTTIEFSETEFNGKAVYSLTYREAIPPMQLPVTVTSNGLLAIWDEHGITQNTMITYTVSLFIDRHTYTPVGFISKDPTSKQTFIHEILEYQIIDEQQLDFNPFLWPPSF